MKKFITIAGICCIVPIIVVAAMLVSKKSQSSISKSSYNLEPLEPIAEPGIAVGQIAPDFSFVTLEGKRVRLSDLRGEPALIAFFASWCTPCLIEAENVREAQTQVSFKVIQVGVDPREPLEDIWGFKVNVANPDWFITRDSTQAIAELYNVRALDTTLLIDANGKILYRDNGVAVSAQQIVELLN